MIDQIIFKRMSQGLALLAVLLLFVVFPISLHVTLQNGSLVSSIIAVASVLSSIFFASVSYTFHLMAGPGV